MRLTALSALLLACSRPAVAPVTTPIEMSITFDDLPASGPGSSCGRLQRRISIAP